MVQLLGSRWYLQWCYCNYSWSISCIHECNTALDGLGIDIQADRDAWYKTLLTMTYEKSATNGLANVAGTTSGTGNVLIALLRLKLVLLH